MFASPLNSTLKRRCPLLLEQLEDRSLLASVSGLEGLLLTPDPLAFVDVPAVHGLCPRFPFVAIVSDPAYDPQTGQRYLRAGSAGCPWRSAHNRRPADGFVRTYPVGYAWHPGSRCAL